MFTYTRKLFGERLKEKVSQAIVPSVIGAWAYSVYNDDVDPYDKEFLNILLIIAMMEEGPEFELSYKRLNEIADDLIAGKKDINTDY